MQGMSTIPCANTASAIIHTLCFFISAPYCHLLLLNPYLKRSYSFLPIQVSPFKKYFEYQLFSKVNTSLLKPVILNPHCMLELPGELFKKYQSTAQPVLLSG